LSLCPRGLFVVALAADHSVLVENRFKDPGSRRIRRLSIAGDGLPERIRSTVVAMLGVTVAAGLGLVLLFAEVGALVLSLAPLPDPPAASRTPDHGLQSTASVEAGSAAATAPAAGLASVALTETQLEAPGDVEGGPLAAVLVQSTVGGRQIAAAGQGAGSTGSGGSAQGNSGPAAHSPGESPSDGPESEPAPTPVSGSSSSSGLFVRKSVVKDPGELGEISEGSPLPNPEPEPEPPAEPAPEAEAPAGPESPPGAEDSPPAA